MKKIVSRRPPARPCDRHSAPLLARCAESQDEDKSKHKDSKANQHKGEQRLDRSSRPAPLLPSIQHAAGRLQDVPSPVSLQFQNGHSHSRQICALNGHPTRMAIRR